jgi:CheY-like chemotaxis protein
VKKFVDAMNGTIEVQSEIGKGTSFLVTLAFEAIPLSELTEHFVSLPSTHHPEELLKGKRILICEDNALNQEIIRAILSEKGILVDLAGDGKQGLEKFEASPLGYYAGILMDVHMPVMDGYEATVRIRSLERKDARSVPIIAMTADAFAEDIQKAKEAGMNGHIAKPIDPRQVFQTLLGFFD